MNRLHLAILLFASLCVLGVGGRADAQDPPKTPPSEHPEFPDYQPKTSPDTLSDYRSSINGALSRLPPADLASLPALIDALQRAQRRALTSPGTWRDGNPGLGGEAREYVPSDEELIEAALGLRVADVIASTSAVERRERLSAGGVKLEVLRYHVIHVHHSDVMGSGRFFYASEPLEVVLALEK